MNHPNDPNYSPLAQQSVGGQSKPANPLDVQQGGVHYKNKAIQPVEYISANNLNFLEGCVVKRITRWRNKPGKDRFEDLRKIQHEIDLLIAMEERFNPQETGVDWEAEYRKNQSEALAAKYAGRPGEFVEQRRG